MNFSAIVKRMARDYLLIFAGIVICVSLLNHLNAVMNDLDASEFSLGLRHIYAIMMCALVGVLPSLLFYFPSTSSEKGMRMRILIHFIIVEAVLLIFTNRMGWVTGAAGATILALQVAIIYMLVCLLGWNNDRQVAREINEQLMKLKKTDEQ
ncbi:DUF3021 family protein [Paenibacillus dendritiformis]|uniref:DUF3021 domain-containing protein n=1 Tax=Paenibacillus dendritiformis C454 TaxID=1131935 RepID=H3S9A6_9BACL|nr:DUF3021 family protein [Paenibacillus dendritiformis]EHQ64354.1 hypothetical protein PDENDC454_00530 [Paenibacillus dendritiformis C454]CAH8770431.1 DUF3021 domain-containing protein [Paenibacillus dendritiformis]